MPAVFAQRKKVAIPDLSYPTYYAAAHIWGAEVFFYPAHEPLKNFPHKLDYIIINTPHNPLGKSWKREELENLIEQARTKKCIVISDECYGDIYMNQRPYSLLEVAKGDFQGLLVTNSLSKSSNLAGLRSGYLAGDAELVKRFKKIYATTGCTLSEAAQKSSALAWKDIEFINKNRKQYQDFLFRFSKGTSLELPDATFYFFADTGRDSEEVTVDLLRNQGIKVMPGKYLDYSCSGRWDTYVRISVAEEFSDRVIGAIKDAITH